MINIDAIEITTSINPFPGLRPFLQEEDYLFFGREKQIDDLLRKLRTTRFLSVVGVSGSGKSSLVKCGLLSSLYRGYMIDAGDRWNVALFRPGNQPINNLANSIATPGLIYRNESVQTHIPAIVGTTLRRSNRGLIETVKQSDLKNGENLLIVVDQFEEIFRYDALGPQKEESLKNEAAAFINLLLTASSQVEIPIYIVITMRSDFIGECTTFRNLPAVINSGQYLIPRMTRSEIKQAIKGPIAVSGARISERLVSRLLNDVGDDPDQLPILQHALMRTWNHWNEYSEQHSSIDLDNYIAIGEMKSALSKHADEVYEQLNDKHLQKHCENLFRALTDKATDSRGTRRPTRFGHLCKILDATPDEILMVIDQFRKPGRCFLMPPDDVVPNDATVIDISHESIMRIWNKLISWVEEESQSAEVYMRLAESAALYEQGKTGLWRDPDLQIALKWKEKNRPNASWAKRYNPSFHRAMEFLRYSKQKDEFLTGQKQKQQKQRLRLIRTVMVVISIALIIVTLFGLKLWFSNKDLELSEINLATQTKNALEAAQSAQEAKEEALQEKQIAEKQKELAEKNLTYAKQQELIANTAKLKAQHEEARAKKAQMKTHEANIQIAKEKETADRQKRNAEISDSVSNILYLAALSQDLALQSIKAFESKNEKRIPQLLALNAYHLNKKYGHNEFHPDIFKALSLVADENTIVIDDSTAIRAVKFHPDGHYLACGYENGSIRVWNTRDYTKPVEELTASQTNYSNIRVISFHPSKPLLVAGNVNGSLLLWDWQLREEKRIEFAHQGPVTAVTFHPDGKHVISAGADGFIKKWDMDKTDSSFEVLVNMGIKITALSLKKKILAVASIDRKVKVFKIKDMLLKINEYISPDIIQSLTINHKATLLAIGSERGKVSLWHLKQKNPEPLELGTHSGPVTSLSFSNRSGVLATCSLDGNVKIWPYKNPNFEPVIIKVNSRNQWLWSLDISSDGHHLVFGGADKVLRKRIINPAVLFGIICKNNLKKFSEDEWENYTKKKHLQQFDCKTSDQF